MKILWITNILFPEAETVITQKESNNPFGGWLLGAAASLTKAGDIELAVATVSPLVDKLERYEGEKIYYYVIPYGKGNKKDNREYDIYWSEIKAEFNPDVTHIHGTEYSHGLSYLRACGNKNVVISIQGLTSAYYYYYYGISSWLVLKNITLRDIYKGNIFTEKRNFKKRGKYEIQMLKSVHHVIGRTSWDKSRVWAVNPNARYHFCNETLRDVFYYDKWMYSSCTPHTIFVSQASYPIKGLHQLLKAMPLVLRHYPDTIVRVAGYDLTCDTKLRDKLKLTGYGKIVKRYLSKNHLAEHVQFTGPLSAKGMKKEYLRANLFVCPSSIENSPNSLGEAQLLGVPCISAYVGGAMDMIPNDKCGILYRFEEIETLAWRICQVFENSQSFDNSKMREIAFERHSPEKNTHQLMNIYQSILSAE